MTWRRGFVWKHDLLRSVHRNPGVDWLTEVLELRVNERAHRSRSSKHVYIKKTVGRPMNAAVGAGQGLLQVLSNAATSAHLHHWRHTIKCLRDIWWPAANPHIVKDFIGIARSVERVFVTDIGEGPTHLGAVSDLTRCLTHRTGRYADVRAAFPRVEPDANTRVSGRRQSLRFS